ncbi:HAMP domain-containing histidine kinase [Myxococcus sp. CA051A]|uniref:sensor histidine kinase n=1 Tax=unclassified Myxococcus TaxID=2648731 RepID=UPI00157B8D4B|nr:MULTISPECIES: HAMP domain-containing sensor histidine kinase [unclassified Myxococcus]NTX12393.1 HAMP domain-containing histidine kinase [Myxococcus sp. CA056]NTX33412.1 HAMP domain-containing histidine kinase [Myxococcus sp. CA033]NTX55264.1 HAMP domain-containing histidine kinase [Myxococcus sp. CA039A]NTX59480.1 HAMP domain-containing histidine kinase [Myxococcus sp. CA051A]
MVVETRRTGLPGEGEREEGSSEEESRQPTGELEQRVLERTAALEAALRVRDEFLSVASHELRTPLTSLRLYVDGLVRSAQLGALGPEDVPRRLARVQDQCGRLDRLIATLLDVSLLSTQRPVLDLEEVDLGQLVRHTVERMEEDVRRAGCDLCLRAPPGIVGAWDRTRVEQVFTNLLTNALRHAAGTAIEVALRAEPHFVLLWVRDEGPGISPEDQARLFQRFSRLDPTRPGFGLGLWISRQLVELHGGSLSVESAPGQGARFTVRLPLPAPLPPPGP